MRIVACAGAGTIRTPKHVTDYSPEDAQGSHGPLHAALARLFKPRLRISLAFGPLTLSNGTTDDFDAFSTA